MESTFRNVMVFLSSRGSLFSVFELALMVLVVLVVIPLWLRRRHKKRKAAERGVS